MVKIYKNHLPCKVVWHSVENIYSPDVWQRQSRRDRKNNSDNFDSTSRGAYVSTIYLPASAIYLCTFQHYILYSESIR